MSRFFSFFIYLIYKGGIVYVSWLVLQHFNMRYDLLVLLFYGFLTVFQLAFVLIQSLPKKKITSHLGSLFQNTTIITVFMELAILGMTVYYLFKQENDIFNLLFLVTLLTPAHALFYFLHNIAFSRVIRKLQTAVRHVSALPSLLFLLITFAVPAAYLVVKTTLKTGIGQKDLVMDILVTAGAIVFSLVILYAQLAAKVLKSKAIVKRLKSVNLFQLTAGTLFTVDDPNEFGYIQSEMNDLSVKLTKERENISLLNDYISKNMRDEAVKFGISPKGEIKTATICSIRFTIPDNNITPENNIRIVNAVTLMIGQYADEYEAYPFFTHGSASLVFGAPFYFEHQKLNAVEAAQRLACDLEKFARDESVAMKVSIGIYSGKVITGTVNTKGKGFKEFTVTGESMDIADRIAAAAENTGAALLVSASALDDMKGKFTAEKSYKIRLKSGQEIAVHQIKI
jgi:hypothetical protein